ncbi:MAG: metalloregulator ArsR/SmtB family transcription factor [Pseudomonadota bacterium]
MDQVLEILRAAGEATRLRILLVLQEGELTVTELVQILGQSQPRVSRHLKLLASSGVVEWVREGSWVFYRLSRDAAGTELVQWISQHVRIGDDVVRRDMANLEDVRQKRQAAADAYFFENASQWDQIRALQGSGEAVEKAFLSAVRHKPGITLLDMGTGTGRMLEVFSPMIEHGVGVDANPAMLKLARARALKTELQNCQVQLGDMYGLEQPENAFDLIILHQVLHFAEAPERVLAEAARVLKTGGQMLVADYAPHTHEFLREKHAHRRLGFSKQDIVRWSEKAGLEISHVTRVLGPELATDVWDARKPEANARTTRQGKDIKHTDMPSGIENAKDDMQQETVHAAL